MIISQKVGFGGVRISTYLFRGRGTIQPTTRYMWKGHCTPDDWLRVTNVQTQHTHINPATAKEEGEREMSQGRGWGATWSDQWGKEGEGWTEGERLGENTDLETLWPSTTWRWQLVGRKKYREPQASGQGEHGPSPVPGLLPSQLPPLLLPQFYSSSLTLLVENLMRPSVNGSQILSPVPGHYKPQHFFPLTCCWFSNYSCSK